MNGTGRTSEAIPANSELTPAQQDQQPGLTIHRGSRASSRQELGASQSQTEPTFRRRSNYTAAWISVATCAALLVGVAAPIALKIRAEPNASRVQSVRYLGLYELDLSQSYAGVAAFTTATGIRPDVLMYYSSWLEPFQVSFAAMAAAHGAVPLVQINPFGVDLNTIASGQYDGYLRTYATAIRTFGHPVIIGFGHEMNGNWYPWGNTHTSPAIFVAAWRHIVTVFRGLGVNNVIWLWTANIIQPGGIPSPAAWWPGSSYVTWVGIDGYYYQPSWTFASLFGPTIAAVRELTRDPILIGETGAAAGSSQPAKISDLFAGVRLYGLLGFVWFNVKAERNWILSSRAAFAAFRQGEKIYRPRS